MKKTYAFEHEPIEYCAQCPCFFEECGYCMLGYQYGYNDPWNTPKPEDCPLVEV